MLYLLDLPWASILGDAWKQFRSSCVVFLKKEFTRFWSITPPLELLDASGKKAHFTKRKKVRYLQDDIIAYQDHAWGDGKILQNYQCSPGKAVDQYRAGFKTFVLISLQRDQI